MYTTLNTLAAVMACMMFVATASAQSARDIVGPSPLVAVENEPPPKLIVDPPLAGPLCKGLVFIQYRTENLRVVPVDVGARPAIQGIDAGVTIDDVAALAADDVFDGGQSNNSSLNGGLGNDTFEGVNAGIDLLAPSLWASSSATTARPATTRSTAATATTRPTTTALLAIRVDTTESRFAACLNRFLQQNLP